MSYLFIVDFKSLVALKLMSAKPYATDLTDAEWSILSPLIPKAKTGGHPRTVDMRLVCNAIYYQLKTGCQWHLLPHDFPPSSTVYFYYSGS
ncbi:hypothetical protein C1752_07904 [Acaryochloris thomasi RCC1774]|uniref:Insertion element IS402-like domain-containing protein n=1 Tax=Acaryochloris thomasi RCC1774 TaxID=1764569 RepID=A0A2W1JB42_9CYAN|nr:hypothetical protein C1752_07904 [Acaryochloris thomasi RCC1774]